MAAPNTKNETERIERRARVSELYFQGNSMAQVGKMLNVSHDTIFRDLRWAREQWRTRAADAIEAHVQRELAKIDITEEEAWRAWHRSIGKHVVTFQKANGRGTETITKSENLPGDPHHLDAILKCVDRRCKILGLYAPTKISDPNGAPIVPALQLIFVDRNGNPIDPPAKS